MKTNEWSTISVLLEMEIAMLSKRENIPRELLERMYSKWVKKVREHVRIEDEAKEIRS